jgi:hypothetical protein
LADYFVNNGFRRELRRVLNRGEAVNALKRAIYTGRVTPAQAWRNDEMQAVADALSPLANIVMAWNTAQMQAVLDRWANRRQIVPRELIGRVAPTRLEGIDLRGVFRFPVERVTKCSQNKGKWLKSTSEWCAFQGCSRGSRKLCGDKHLRASPARNPRQCSSVNASVFAPKSNRPPSGPLRYELL